MHYIITFFDINTVHNFVYVSKSWHMNEDVWKMLCWKQGINQTIEEEKRLSWKQLFTECTTYVQVVDGYHCSLTGPALSRDDVPLQQVVLHAWSRGRWIDCNYKAILVQRALP